MVRKFHILGLAGLVLLLPEVTLAQAPPKPSTPVAPKTEQLDPNACAHGRATVGAGGDIDTQSQRGQNLSDKLARSEGVICPPARIDPEIRQPTPPGGPMPVIPPPGSPGGDQSVQPK